MPDLLELMMQNGGLTPGFSSTQDIRSSEEDEETLDRRAKIKALEEGFSKPAEEYRAQRLKEEWARKGKMGKVGHVLGEVFAGLSGDPRNSPYNRKVGEINSDIDRNRKNSVDLMTLLKNEDINSRAEKAMGLKDRQLNVQQKNMDRQFDLKKYQVQEDIDLKKKDGLYKMAVLGAQENRNKILEAYQKHKIELETEKQKPNNFEEWVTDKLNKGVISQDAGMSLLKDYQAAKKGDRKSAAKLPSWTITTKDGTKTTTEKGFGSLPGSDNSVVVEPNTSGKRDRKI